MTPLLAATATGLPPESWAAGLGGLVLAGLAYVVSCWVWPIRRCWVCEGRGLHAREDGQVFRRCRWCRGSGGRLRIGRRVWNHFAAARRDGGG